MTRHAQPEQQRPRPVGLTTRVFSDAQPGELDRPAITGADGDAVDAATDHLPGRAAATGADQFDAAREHALAPDDDVHVLGEDALAADDLAGRERPVELQPVELAPRDTAEAAL